MGAHPVARGDRRDLSLQGRDHPGSGGLLGSRDRPLSAADRYAMRTRKLIGPLMVIGGLLMAYSSVAQKPLVQVDIAAMQADEEPSDFAFWRTRNGAPAEWRVVSDPTAAHQAAIAQTSTDTTDYRFPLAVYKPVSAGDVDVTLRFKPVGGKVDQAGGIAVRLTTYGDYYVVRANALEDNVRFYRVVKGRREQLDGANIKIATNE